MCSIAIPASCSKQMQRNARMAQADAHHAASRHVALTTTRTLHRYATAHSSRMLTHFPASKESRATRYKRTLQPTKAMRAFEMHKGPNPTPRATRTYHISMHAASMCTAEAPGKRRRTLGSWVGDSVPTNLASFTGSSNLSSFMGRPSRLGRTPASH